jgi:hypothetical protein
MVSRRRKCRRRMVEASGEKQLRQSGPELLKGKMKNSLAKLALSGLVAFTGIALYASDASLDYPLRVKILDVAARGVANQAVPLDCNFQTYSAYCNGSQSPSAENVMLVQASDGSTFSMTCPSEWSGLGEKCAPLPVGATYEARLDNRRLTVIYLTAKGKEKKQTYVLTTDSVPSVAGNSLTSRPGATSGASSGGLSAGTETVAAPAAAAASSSPEKVKCSFTSVPAGAEITVDGMYIGSTPSERPIGTGEHSIVLSLRGYTPWSRQMTVVPGSELTISSILQKE